MLTRVVRPGDKVELQTIEDVNEPEEIRRAKKKYNTTVYDVISDDRIELVMPMEKTKLILLPIDGEFDICFFTKGGMYQCFVRIVERYKTDSNYVMVAEVVSNLRKFQRRDYYRFSCILEMETRVLREEEVDAINKNLSYLVPTASLRRAVIVDISGGGIRFIAKEPYKIGDMIYCKYRLQLNNMMKEYNLVGKVLSCDALPNKIDEYSHRVEYIGIDNVEREEIIKYIFDEERKNRKKEKGR